MHKMYSSKDIQADWRATHHRLRGRPDRLAVRTRWNKDNILASINLSEEGEDQGEGKHGVYSFQSATKGVMQDDIECKVTSKTSKLQ